MKKLKVLACLLLMGTMFTSVFGFSAAAKVSTDELNEIAGIRTPGTNITTTTVTATTSDGKVETYDITIDHDFYDISYTQFTIYGGLTGTAIQTLSDMSSTTIGDYKYIEDIVVPKTVTSIVNCVGHPKIVVIPKTVTTLASMFGEFRGNDNDDELRQKFLEAYKDKSPSSAFRSDFHNPYYPYVMVLYEGTEAEWQAINKPDYVYANGKVVPNRAQVLYEKGYVRFNCNYYDIVEGKTDTSKPVTNTASTVSGFKDVTTDKYYAESVEWAVDENITKGVTATAFRPDNTCSQAQILTFIWRSQGSPKVDTVAPIVESKNITPANYYYDAVNWGYANGMIDGSFNPNSPCSRSLAMQYLYQMAGSPAVTGDGTMQDVPESARYHDAVYWAMQQGITNGTTGTTFAPASTCTRAQIVTFLWRALAQ